MRVLMYCGHYRPIIGGAEKLTEVLAQALASKGVQVTLMTQRVDHLSPDIEIENGVTVERFILRSLTETIRIPGIGFLNIFYIMWQISSAFSKRLSDFDVVHCHIASLQAATIALLGMIRSRPVLVTTHTANWHSDLGNLKRRSRTGLLVAWFARVAIRHWVAISQSVKNELVAAGVPASHIHDIPNGIRLGQQRLKKGREPKVQRFLYMGRLSTNSGRDIQSLITAFSRLATEYPDVELAIVGGGDLLESYREMAKSSAAPDRIDLPGFDKADHWYDWADCFVLPSRFEGLSLALLEAMSFGLPCIANDIGPNREALDSGTAGVLVPVGDANALYMAMKKMANDDIHACNYRNAALERVETQYDINKIANTYLDFYKTLIKNA